MRRYLTSCIITLIGITGGLLTLGSLLFFPIGPAEFSRGDWLRISSLGMVISGIYSLLYRKSDPDYIPEWFKRHILLYLAVFWFFLAGVTFVVSWFRK